MQMMMNLFIDLTETLMAVPMSMIKYQSPLAVAVEMMTSRIAGVNRSCNNIYIASLQ